MDAITSKEQRVLLNYLCIFPIIVVYVLLVKVVFCARWHIGRHNLPLAKCYPLEIVEPGVLLDFVITVKTQSV